MAGERGDAVGGDSPFRVSHTVLHDGTNVVSVKGEIDVGVAAKFERALDEAVQSAEASGIVVDLSEVTFLDSTALTALVHCFERQRARLQRFSVVADDNRVRSLLEVTRLDQLLNLYASRDEAKAFVSDWT